MFYQIKVPAYFNTRLNMQRAENVFHVVGTAAKDKHIAQIMKQGGNPVAVELTEREFRAANYRSA
jgi:hypothetical protein